MTDRAVRNPTQDSVVSHAIDEFWGLLCNEYVFKTPQGSEVSHAVDESWELLCDERIIKGSVVDSYA